MLTTRNFLDELDGHMMSFSTAMKPWAQDKFVNRYSWSNQPKNNYHWNIQNIQSVCCRPFELTIEQSIQLIKSNLYIKMYAAIITH